MNYPLDIILLNDATSIVYFVISASYLSKIKVSVEFKTWIRTLIKNMKEAISDFIRSVIEFTKMYGAEIALSLSYLWLAIKSVI